MASGDRITDHPPRTDEQEGPRLLLKGREFRCIPQVPAGVIFDLAEPNNTRVHQWARGDTAGSVEQRYRLEPGQLAEWNPTLRDGQSPKTGDMVLVERPSMEWARRYRRILYTIVADEDHERLDEALYDREDAPAFLDIVTAISQAIASYSDRPTERPSSSRAGASSTEPRSRVVSLSPGTRKKSSDSEEGGRSAAS